MLRRLGSFINGSQSGIDAAVKTQIAQQKEVEQARIDNLTRARLRVAWSIPGSTLQYIGLPVTGDTSTIFDILVDPRSGAARKVVVAQADQYSSVDPVRVTFTNATAQQPPAAALPSKTIAKPYAPGKGKAREVSLRRLQGASILDDEQKPAGMIDTIVYRDNIAQALIFTVPGVQIGTGTMFTLPYIAVAIGTNPKGGLFAQLDHAQTIAVAEAMVPPKPIVQTEPNP